MAKATRVTAKRRREITKIVRDQIVCMLQADLDGEDEAIMKEAWEACDDAVELAIADDVLRSIIKLIKRGV